MIVSNTATGTNEIMARSGHCALADRAASDRDRELADIAVKRYDNARQG